jgi:nucleoside-diphosphate-sugar epimerase
VKVLFIGGSGLISSACSRLAVERGIELTWLNRGQTHRRPAPEGVRVITGDIRNVEECKRVLEGEHFDCVVDWIAFTPEHIESDLELFRGKTVQYIFISSASVYQSQPAHYLITESTPLHNPHWDYSRNKIACEERLNKALREESFPAVIVRPSYTYDTIIPVAVGASDYTVPDRILRGAPVISHGDGSSLWNLTHSEDFAKGFVGLLGNVHTIGHSFHITSDEVLTWDQIYSIIGEAVGAKTNLIHIPSDFIVKFDPNLGVGLLGDKTRSAIMDNTKIKRFVPEFQATIPFSEGVRRALAWFEEDPARKTISESSNARMDACIAAYNRAFNALGTL